MADEGDVLLDLEDSQSGKELLVSSLAGSKTERLTKSMKKYLLQPFLIGFALAFGMSLGTK